MEEHSSGSSAPPVPPVRNMLSLKRTKATYTVVVGGSLLRLTRVLFPALAMCAPRRQWKCLLKLRENKYNYYSLFLSETQKNYSRVGGYYSL